MNSIFSTGILGLDIALASGGIPRGCLVEIFGPEKCGKTALCLSILSEVQKLGGQTAFIDLDQTLDPSHVERLGINSQKVIYSRPENARQATDIARTLTRTGAIDLLVFDSITCLLAMGVQIPGKSNSKAATRLLAQTVRELSALAPETGTTILFTNEWRERAGYIYGVPVTTSGGIALKLHAAIRLEMTPCDTILARPNKIGEKIRVKIVKPKSLLFHTTIINIMYNGVVSRLDNLFDLAVEMDLINKQDGFYSYGRFSLGRGREAVITCLREHPRAAENIETDIRTKYFSSSAVLSDEDSS